MANFIDKIRMKSAANKPHKFRLTSSHLTSQNFNQHAPIYSKVLVPNSKFSIKVSSFARLNPMPQPTFMASKIYNRAFFVPFRIVWEPFNSFITNTPHNTGSSLAQVTQVPYVTMRTLAQFLVGSPSSPVVVMSDYAIKYSGQVPTNGYDICVPHGNTSDFFRLTPKGRFVVRILESLGYKIDFSVLSDDIKHADGYKFFRLSALPLLSYAKVLFDWFFPGQYLNYYQGIVDLCKLFNKHDTFEVTYDDLKTIFDFCELYFSESSYFVNAFDSPDLPNMYTDNVQSFVFENRSGSQLPNSSNYETVIGGTNILGVPFATKATDGNASNPDTIQPNVSSDNTLNHSTSWQVAALSRLSAWMKRNQLAGAKIIDRYLARFGVQLSEEKSNRSYYLGSDSFYIQFGDVMATSDTDTGSLGDYAGKGIAFSESDSFSCQTDEFGIFLVINTVSPDVSYSQGLDRSLLATKLMDFYQPEFDGLGCEPIAKFELWSPRSYFDWQHAPSEINDSGVGVVVPLENFGWKIFGFTPRYSSYKLSRDLVTGNFSNPSTDLGYQCWTNMRYILPFDSNDHLDTTAKLRHSPEFMVDDGKQYDRIFYQNEGLIDGINFSHYFNAEYYAPMKPLYDSFEFEHEQDKDAVKINSQGSKL